MGKFRKRVGCKGKRWKKGQSSSSNPEANKFRNAAKSRFFQENLSNSNLTEYAVRKHELFLGGVSKSNSSVKSMTDISDDESCAESSIQGTFKTFETFASDWSNCSNTSFNKLLNNFTHKSAMHKEMLAILAAVTEVIKERNGTENSTEYFAALMTLIDGMGSEDDSDESSACASLSLLSMVIKTVPKGVLQLKFSDSSKTLLTLLSKFAQSESNVIMRSIIGCLSVLLRAQEIGAWSEPSTMKVYESILSFCTHSKPKIRKAAQHAICAILKASHCVNSEENVEEANSSSKTYRHPAANVTSAYIIRNIELNPVLGGSTTTLHILALLKDVISSLNKSNVKACCESILKVMTLGNVLIISNGLQTMHALFLSRPCPISTCTPQLNAQIINALYDYQPPSSDVQPTLAWLTTLQEAFCNLGAIELNLCVSNLYRFFNSCTHLWLSDKVEIVNGATHTIQVLLEDCIAPAASEEHVAKYKVQIRKIFELFEKGMGYQYNSSWKQVLHIISIAFKVAGATCHEFMTKCLKNLAELRDSYNFSHVNELDYAIGAAVRSMGPEVVLKNIPYQITFNEKSNEIKRSWLLPVLKVNIQSARIQFFIEFFLPLATICRNKAQEYRQLNTVGNVSYDLLQTQIWSLLPSFCNKPTDIENFPNIAKTLGNVLTHHKDLRLTVMLSLRKLIEHHPDSPIMKKYAKNYLPILLNIFTTQPKGTDEENTRTSAYQTIAAYAALADKDLCHELLQSAMSKLKKASEANNDKENKKSKAEVKFLKESILDVIRVFLPHQAPDVVEETYHYVISILKETKDATEFKKSYKILLELCKSETEGCKEFVDSHSDELIELLLEPMASKVATPSQASRIKCFTLLLPQLSEEQLLNIIPPAVLGIKSVNTKCRSSSFELITKLADKMMEMQAEQGLFTLIDNLSVGLEDNPKLISATILALASVTHHCRSHLLTTESLNNMIDNVLVMLTSSTREIVASCLSYVKLLFTSFHKDDVAPYVDKIVKTISRMAQDCKRHFRCKIKDIFARFLRKYGNSTIFKLIPSHDEVLIKQVKNMIKIRERKAKNREKAKDGEGDSDEDEFAVKSKPKTINEILDEIEKDDDEQLMELDEKKLKDGKKKKKKKEAFITENEDEILDFTEVTNLNKISQSKPTQTAIMQTKQKIKKKDDFKMSADGRLIIAESDDDSDDGAEKLKNMKIKEDSEEDEEDKEEPKNILLNRKRKRSSDTASMMSGPANKYQAGGSGIHRPLLKPSINKAKKIEKDPGAVYRSKKAKGDVKKKGLPDPYAYVPLSRKSLNKRKKNKTSGQFKSIVRGAKKGAKLGKSMKSKMAKKNKK